jgi:pimeloyl-ACP methyl ester carboxylesterase
MTTTAQRFNTGEVELSYLEWPGESPPVVMLHGITVAASVWDARRTILGRQRGIAYTARGHSGSGRKPGAYRFVDFGRDCVEFLRHVVGQPAVLVGHSLGAMTAIYAAAKCPELVLAAGLIDPGLYFPEFGVRKHQEIFERRFEAAGKPVDEVKALGFTQPFAAHLAEMDPDAVGHVLSGASSDGWDTDGLLREIKCPVLLEYGELELGSAIYPGEVERAKSQLANCTAVEIKGSGHAPQAQQTEKFYEVFSDFVQRVSASARSGGAVHG